MLLFSGYPENYQMPLKQFFQSIKHNDEFQFKAVVFMVQKET